MDWLPEPARIMYMMYLCSNYRFQQFNGFVFDNFYLNPCSHTAMQGLKLNIYTLTFYSRQPKLVIVITM